jgi:hypothetical protein
MDKAFRNMICVTGLVILVVALSTFFLAEIEFYKFTILFSVGLILVSIRIYDFPNLDQFLLIGAGWFLGIYGMSSLFTKYDTFSFGSLNIGIWYLIYPSLVILYQLTDLASDKNWHVTSIAALDTFVIFGSILLLISAINSVAPFAFAGGVTGDWREIYAYGIILLLYATARRDGYKDTPKAHWNEYWKKISGVSAFLGGLLMLSVSISSFIISSSIPVPVFMVEALGGIFVCFTVYLLFQK